MLPERCHEPTPLPPCSLPPSKALPPPGRRYVSRALADLIDPPKSRKKHRTSSKKRTRRHPEQVRPALGDSEAEVELASLHSVPSLERFVDRVAPPFNSTGEALDLSDADPVCDAPRTVPARSSLDPLSSEPQGPAQRPEPCLEEVPRLVPGEPRDPHQAASGQTPVQGSAAGRKKEFLSLRSLRGHQPAPVPARAKRESVVGPVSPRTKAKALVSLSFRRTGAQTIHEEHAHKPTEEDCLTEEVLQDRPQPDPATPYPSEDCREVQAVPRRVSVDKRSSQASDILKSITDEQREAALASFVFVSALAPPGTHQTLWSCTSAPVRGRIAIVYPKYVSARRKGPGSAA